MFIAIYVNLLHVQGIQRLREKRRGARLLKRDIDENKSASMIDYMLQRLENTAETTYLQGKRDVLARSINEIQENTKNREIELNGVENGTPTSSRDKSMLSNPCLRIIEWSP